MKPTIKTTWAEIRKNTGREGVDHIAITHLGKYGFTEQIINDMLKFDIFPQAYLVAGEVYVVRDEIFGHVVRRLLENSMTTYQAVADMEENAKKVQEAMEQVVLDDEALEKLASGEWDMDFVRERSKGLIESTEKTTTTEGAP